MKQKCEYPCVLHCVRKEKVRSSGKKVWKVWNFGLVASFSEYIILSILDWNSQNMISKVIIDCIMTCL